ncbi:MAG: hypothetical protein MZW92_27200 [Comamonadaceae bacterium]|nr:hypothetical protein [Comamonadaceae bacterium]
MLVGLRALSRAASSNCCGGAPSHNNPEATTLVSRTARTLQRAPDARHASRAVPPRPLPASWPAFRPPPCDPWRRPVRRSCAQVLTQYPLQGRWRSNPARCASWAS